MTAAKNFVMIVYAQHAPHVANISALDVHIIAMNVMNSIALHATEMRMKKCVWNVRRIKSKNNILNCNNHNKVMIILLTGEIGSGKSTVASYLKTKGFIEESFADPISINTCRLYIQ